MTLSRKEFLTRGLIEFGRELVQAVRGEEVPAPDMNSGDVQGKLLIDNNLCLARGGGCFTCQEQCAAGALLLVPGQGLLVLPELCSGCGTCVSVCPLQPKGIALVRRDAEDGPGTRS